MPSQPNPTRQRLIDAALDLFASQGVTETTTKQIAELASVNEVTLFRHFGNKHGLLLAVMQESPIFADLGESLVRQADNTSTMHLALKEYATACLQALEGVPQVIRSVVGEAGQYPSENREALGRGFTQANRYVAEYFQTAIARGQLHPNLSAEKLASLLNAMLLGYATIEFTSDFHELWQGRAEFLENLVTLFLHGAVSSEDLSLAVPAALEDTVDDLPASLVNLILQAAKKAGLQPYALIYVLFGSGLSPQEIVGLERSHYIADDRHQLLQVTRGSARQVPLNQWIMGKRYGTIARNPLTQWLKSRKDSQSTLFVCENGEPISAEEIKQQWQELTSELLAPSGQQPAIAQAQQTWCVEMLMRGMSVEDMCILTGWDADKLQPYARRTREKAALEQASRLDRKI